MNVMIGKPEEAIVEYREVSDLPKVGDLILYNKNKKKRVIAIIDKTSTSPAMVIVERFICKIGVYNVLTIDEVITLKAFAINKEGIDLGQILDKDAMNLKEKQLITGNRKSKLLPLSEGTNVKIERVKCDSPFIWAKYNIGIIEICNHPSYIIKFPNGNIISAHRNQIRSLDERNKHCFFINIT